MVELYEAQAAAFREQIRRLAAESADDGAVGGQAELEEQGLERTSTGLRPDTVSFLRRFRGIVSRRLDAYGLLEADVTDEVQRDSARR